MSYILDALRRADAEREREAGAVPTLHTPARPVMEHEDDMALSRGERPAWMLPAAGVGLLLAGAAVYALLGTSESYLPPAPQAGLSSGVVAPVPPTSPDLPAAPGNAPLPPTAAARLRASPPPPLPAPASSMPGVAVKPVAHPTAAAPESGTAKQAPSTATAATKRAIKLAELPDALRRELPPMAIAGSMHSPERAGRMLILNGQVRREGDAVAPGLVLEEIGAKSAIFGFKGQRIEFPL